MRAWLVGLWSLAAGLGCMASDRGSADASEGACLRTGCSHQLCADHDVITPCLWYPEYACYRGAICERQDDGACGWTATPALAACLASP
jgi:hypothetical protein